MQIWIQRIVIYVILITVLHSLAGKAQYQQFFRFVSGLVLILLLLSPLLHFFGGNVDIYRSISSYFYQQDMEEIGELMQSAEGRMQEMMEKEYADALRSQVEQIAGELGLKVQKLSVQMQEDGSLQGMEVYLEPEETVTKSVLAVFRKKLAESFQLGEERVVLWI